MYGTMTMVSRSSICCNDSLHSRSASDMYSSSSAEELAEEDEEEEEGRESMSASEELTCGSMKLWLLLRDMAAGCDIGVRDAGSATAASYPNGINEAES